MKLSVAKDLISKHQNKDAGGFVVMFERREGSLLASDYFPEVREGESAIATLQEAHALALDFAQANVLDVVNVAVHYAWRFTRVPGAPGSPLNPHPAPKT